VREATPEAPPAPILYVSAAQRPGQAARADIIVRGPEPASLMETARRIVREADPDVPATLRTVSGALDSAVGSRRFTLWLVGAFGFSALVLATLGVYGLMAFHVSQRMREMGIRMALGAEPRSLVWLIVRRGAALTLTGAVVGVVVARAASGALEGLLYGVTTGDPLTIAGAVVLVVIVSALASFAPGLRILRQSPGNTLREGV
jgi:predicted lysophospholipase L1 biosynthesis ABC-type transport system permease subunit